MESIAVESKWCPECKTQKAAGEFGRWTYHWTGLQSWCKACKGQKAKAKRAAARVERDAEKERLPDGLKRCLGCSDVKPFDEFWKHPRCPDGRNPRCKRCTSSNHAVLERNQEHARLRADGLRRCAGCREVKALGDFKYGARDGRCTPCLAQKYRDWQLANPKAIQAAGKRYRAKPGSQERAAQRGRRWRQNSPEKARLGAIRYRTKKMALPCDLSVSDRQRCLEYWGNRCAVCGQAPGLFHVLALDHWIPIKSPFCPGTIPSNIVPLCQAKSGGFMSCNPTKSARDPIEWLTERLGPRKAKRKLAEINRYFASVSRS